MACHESEVFGQIGGAADAYCRHQRGAVDQRTQGRVGGQFDGHPGLGAVFANAQKTVRVDGQQSIEQGAAQADHLPGKRLQAAARPSLIGEQMVRECERLTEQHRRLEPVAS